MLSQLKETVEKLMTKLLLIEDDVIDADLIQEFLELSENISFEVVWIKQLKESLAYLGQNSVDAILCDLSLPDSQGLPTFQKVHQQATTTPILVFSGLEDKTLARQAVQQGAQDYLVKGKFESDLLERAISYAIERKQKELELNELNEELNDSLLTQTMLNNNLLKTTTELNEAKKNMEEELEQAKITQMSLLPNLQCDLTEIQIAAQYIPMERVGGDFYDFIHLSDKKMGFLIADVSGHGVAAALLASLFSGLFKTFAPGTQSPAELLKTLNEALYNKIPDFRFVTAFYYIYDAASQVLTYASAGHPPGFIVRSQTQEIFPMEFSGFVLGPFIKKSLLFQDTSFELIPGDRVILYTDGILETKNYQGKIFGHESLRTLFLNHAQMPVDKMIEQVCAEVLAFSAEGEVPGHFEDDITLLGMEVLP